MKLNQYRKCLTEEMNNYDGFVSYTGWNGIVKPKLWNKINRTIELCEKAKKMLRKCKTLFYN